MNRGYQTKYARMLSLLVIMMLALGACTIPEADPVTVPATVDEATGPTSDETSVTAEDTDEMMPGIANAQEGLVTASSLLDRSITNLNGEAMGEVEDILVNMDSGRVLYVTLEYGGFLELGDREIAVPLQALNWEDGEQLGLNVAEDQLANYPEIDERGSDFSDAGWDEQIREFWNNQGIAQGVGQQEATGSARWASSIIDSGVQDIGWGGSTVDDLLLDVQQGRVKYIVLRYDPGVLENERVAVPLSAFNWRTEGDQLAFAQGVDQEVINAAPSFAPDALASDLIDPSWDDEFANFWEEQGYRLEQEATTGGEATEANAGSETETDTVTGITDAGGIANAQDILIRSSSLLDYDFENIDGEVSGEIEDILLDATTGRILFVTVEYGGFLEISDTELPVPLSAFTWGPGGELVINFEEERLQEFPDLGMNWPDLSQPTWDDNATNFWRNNGIDPGFDLTTASNTILRASEIAGYPVGDVGYGVGSVVDMVIDLGQNRAKYLLISYGTGTVGDDLIAVPFSAFDASAFGDQLVFDSNLDASVLDQAPRFDADLNAGDGRLDPRFDEEFSAYWEDQGYPAGVSQAEDSSS